MTDLRGSCSSVEELSLRWNYSVVSSGSRLDGLWFETWSRPSRRRVVEYCSLVVWQVGSFGGLVVSLGNNNLL